MAENLDQNAIDEILSKAEADTPEGKLSKIEKELDVLKGSIKRLLMDIRETLNNLENPFQNLQGLAESISIPQQQQPQQVQIIPPPPPEPEEGKENGGEEKKEENKIEENRKDEENVAGEDVMFNAHPVSEQKLEGVVEKVGDPDMMPEVVVEEKQHQRSIAKQMITKYDILTLFDIMAWVKGMLEKYSIDSIKLMLEIFESAGYISSEAKDFVAKVADLIIMNDGFEDMLLELYKLHKIMNPNDTSMDSKLLSLILDKRL